MTIYFDKNPLAFSFLNWANNYKTTKREYLLTN